MTTRPAQTLDRTRGATEPVGHVDRRQRGRTPVSPGRLSRRSRWAAVLAGAAIVTAAGTGAAAAATGDLDPTWSGDGIATQPGLQALATAEQPDGRLVVAGTGVVPDGTPANGGTYIARYTRAGTLDPAFGTGGVRRISIAPGSEQVRDVVVDAAGRVLVGGYVAAPDYPDETDVFVLRLTSSGAPDPSFGGGDGIVTIDRTNHDRGAALALSGSRILLGTGLDSGGNFGLQWTVFALTASGAPDTGFSGDGVSEVPVERLGSFDSLRDIAVQPDGKILLGGSTGNEFASVRMTRAGALDRTYGGDGVARTLVDDGGAGSRLLLQPDGKVVVAGYAAARGRSDTDVAAVRWTAGGQLDRSFGGDGRVVLDSGDRRNNRAQAAALAADGKIVLVGSTDTATGMDSLVARLDWDGSPDTSFSRDGLVVTSTLSTSNEQLEAVSVTAGGQVRAVGANLNGWTLLGYRGGADHLLSVGDAAVTEPDSGSATMTFTVRLSPASPTPVTVRYATRNGTASTPADLTARTGVLTIPPGATSRTVTVPVVGDHAQEPDETFTLGLSLPTNAGIADSSGVGTIRDDD